MDPITVAGLQTATALANTDPEVGGEDRLGGVEALRAFFAEHDLELGTRPSDDDVADVHALRRVIRAVFTDGDAAAAVAALNDVIADADLCPRLEQPPDGGAWRWEVRSRTPARPASELAAVAAVALLDLIRVDGLSRLHRCAAHGCAGVFADTTRNRSRRYCIPEICGNRTNLARFRARRRDADAPGG